MAIFAQQLQYLLIVTDSSLTKKIMVTHAGQTLKIVTFFGFNKFVYPKKLFYKTTKKNGKLINDNINYSNKFFFQKKG